MGATHIHLDPLGGIAGDMFIAAVLAAFPDLQGGMTAAIRAAGLPQPIEIVLQPHRDHALTGLRFGIVEAPIGKGSARAHGHRHFRDIKQALQSADLDAAVRDRAIAMFTLLAEAEAQVHGMALEDVGFHELGEWDSIADIVGAAYLIHTVNANWSVGTLPLGGGRVNTAHGPLPVPAPATARLLEGFECFDDGVSGERVTPTGAVILRHLGAVQSRGPQPARLLGEGTGFGTRTLPGLSNVLRVLAFEQIVSARENMQPGCGPRIAEILFEVDDQTPEDLAIGLDRVRAHEGVLDVLQMSALGKKGRMAAHIRVLADPAQLQQVCDVCFEQTTTIGLRYQELSRATLQRQQRAVEVDGQGLAIKAVARPSGITVKLEADELNAAPIGQAGRDRLRRRVAETWEDEENTDDPVDG